ncbi:cytochrome c [Shouchella sp. JSM 1781072]|uniref:c-type cytochrome n=1 Tax=Bacillaceae TaxID=186817 RepID=UPI000C07C4A3|nr:MULTISPECIES: cytochrome c [Bacillaceae]UTR06444.1 cytochrome c [Alkalihalobacillus sp. LMS6]
MKKWMVLAGLTLFLTACGGGDGDDAEAPETDNGNGGEESSEMGDYDVAQAEQTYQQSCIQCHAGLDEGGSGPALANNNLAPDEIREIILNGQGSMPAQSHLEEDEVDNLSMWLADQ